MSATVETGYCCLPFHAKRPDIAEWKGKRVVKLGYRLHTADNVKLGRTDSFVRDFKPAILHVPIFSKVPCVFLRSSRS
jgi:hypothetical protein